MSIRRARSATRYFVEGYPYALDFDGTDDYVSTGSYNLHTYGEYTLEGWINPSVNDFDTPFAVGDGVSGDLWEGLLEDDGSGGFKFRQRGGGTDAIVYATANIGSWQFVSCVWTGSEIRIYKDGVLEGSDSKSDINDLSAELRLGDLVGYGNYYDGNLAEIRLWNVARTQTEIQRDMHRRLSGREPGLVGYWPLWEGEGTTAYDRSGKGNDGSLVNGPTWVTG